MKYWVHGEKECSNVEAREREEIKILMKVWLKNKLWLKTAQVKMLVKIWKEDGSSSRKKRLRIIQIITIEDL